MTYSIQVGNLLLPWCCGSIHVIWVKSCHVRQSNNFDGKTVISVILIFFSTQSLSKLRRKKKRKRKLERQLRWEETMTEVYGLHNKDDIDHQGERYMHWC